MKKCSKCKALKPLDQFHRNRNKKDGRASNCKPCAIAVTLAWARAHPTEHVAHGLAWEKKYPEKAAAKRTRFRKRHPEQHVVAVMKWKRANRDKVSMNAAKNRKLHPEKGAAKTAKYRASKINATPVWANDFFIEEAYDLAKRRTKILGFEWHVDHIVPLRCKTVCGLHNEFNLQVIPGAQNISKSNRWWPDMPQPIQGE